MSQKPHVPTEPFSGVWACDSRVVGTGSEDGSPPATIRIEFRIQENGTVLGHVGEAVMRGFVFQRNRGNVGRWLNIKTDYIIHHGALEGAIYEGDSAEEKEFAFPFNVQDGKLTGTIMRIEGMKYPWPLTPQLLLMRTDKDGR